MWVELFARTLVVGGLVWLVYMAVRILVTDVFASGEDGDDEDHAADGFEGDAWDRARDEVLDRAWEFVR